MQADTIFALSTGAGRSALAVIRISGPAAYNAIQTLAGDIPQMRRASVRTLHDRSGDILDEVLVITFAEGASFTGESSVEIQCHGGPAVVSAIMSELQSLGCRPALPGEFTRRAVMAGRLDLVSAEGLGDLVSAETSEQRRQALRAMGGGTSNKLVSWRSDLVRARALLEVTIDWADEEVPEDVTPEVVSLIEPVLTEMQAELSHSAGAEKVRDGFEVAIVGPPNAGKSSILNAIAGRDAAIVSDMPGTTRDVLEVRCELEGLMVVFLDTAGLRSTTDVVESEGVRRAKSRADAADMRLFISSADTQDGIEGIERQEGDLTVWSKSDLVRGTADVLVSAKTGDGIQVLLDHVGKTLKSRVHPQAMFGRQRQVGVVQSAESAILQCRQSLDRDDIETAADDLRAGITELDRLTGKTGIEDVLDVVFSSFCLGK